MKGTIMQHAKVALSLVVFGTLISVAGASAQTSGLFATFTLPHEVHWTAAVLPPGDYTLSMPTTHSPGIVRSTNGKILAFVLAFAADASEKGGSSLTIVARGNQWKVASMNLPGAGVSLVYSPMTKAERETLAKAKQIEGVPLVAKK